MFMQTLAAAALLTIGTCMSASASDNANAHFKAGGTGNDEQIMHTYGDNAMLQWVVEH
jgi:hypothetical protein